MSSISSIKNFTAEPVEPAAVTAPSEEKAEDGACSEHSADDDNEVDSEELLSQAAAVEERCGGGECDNDADNATIMRMAPITMKTMTMAYMTTLATMTVNMLLMARMIVLMSADDDGMLMRRGQCADDVDGCADDCHEGCERHGDDDYHVACHG